MITMMEEGGDVDTTVKKTNTKRCRRKQKCKIKREKKRKGGERSEYAVGERRNRQRNGGGTARLA